MNPIKWFLRVLRRGLILGAVVAIVLIDFLIMTAEDITSDKLLIIFVCDMLYILIQIFIYYIVRFIIMKED